MQIVRSRCALHDIISTAYYRVKEVCRGQVGSMTRLLEGVPSRFFQSGIKLKLDPVRDGAGSGEMVLQPCQLDELDG